MRKKNRRTETIELLQCHYVLAGWLAPLSFPLLCPLPGFFFPPGSCPPHALWYVYRATMCRALRNEKEMYSRADAERKKER